MTHAAPAPVALTTIDVLVVDDDPDTRAFVREALEDEGYQVASASTGREALNRITRDEPRVVLLDLRLPELDGWQVCTWPRRWGVDTTIVFMSAAEDVRVDAQHHQVAACLPKPFDAARLLDVVERFTERPQA
jgi:DNA-binding response OmpR family regulator